MVSQSSLTRCSDRVKLVAEFKYLQLGLLNIVKNPQACLDAFGRFNQGGEVSRI